jgi:hypothetical protein
MLEPSDLAAAVAELQNGDWHAVAVAASST